MPKVGRMTVKILLVDDNPTFLGAVDEQIAKEAHKAFTKQGLKIELGVKVGDIKVSKKGVSVAWTDAKGAAQTLDVDKLIVGADTEPRAWHSHAGNTHA